MKARTTNNLLCAETQSRSRSSGGIDSESCALLIFIKSVELPGSLIGQFEGKPGSSQQSNELNLITAVSTPSL